MSFNSTQMIHQLRQDFEQLLQAVKGPEAHSATVDQMERFLFRKILRMGFNLLKLFILTRVESESHAPLMEEGEEGLPYHSQKSRKHFSIFGKLTFGRAYFYKSGQGGKCPLDEALNMPERCYSDLLMETADLLAVSGAYRKGLQVMERLLGLKLSELAVETAVAEHSQDVEAYYAQKASFPVAEEGSILVAQADGKGVPMVRSGADDKARRGKGDKKTRKKEAIAIAVYTIEPYQRTPRQVVDALFKKKKPPSTRPVPQHKQIFASMEGKERTIGRLAAWVRHREGEHIGERVALTDGAIPLQRQMLNNLPNFTLILDIIHVNEYLWQAGNALYGETDSHRAEWVEEQMFDILSSHSDRVIRQLEDKVATMSPDSQAAKTLQRIANYLRRNQPYMDYATYLLRGWPIGTGVIEGVCRHLVKDRMELSGMRWTVAGAEAMLALRSVSENGDWDDFHEFRRRQCHQRLYAAPLSTDWLEQIEWLGINQL